MIRLARKPSLWSGFLGRLAFGIVWAGSMFTATWFVWTRGAGTPILAWIFLGILDLFALGIVWDLAIRFWRTINGRQPVLEIDRPSLRYGGSAQLHFVEPHPESLQEIAVRLVADHWVEVSEPDGTTVHTVRNCYDEELLRLNVSDGAEVSRMLQVRIPGSVPSDKPRWKIVVTAELRQGGVIEHAFPIAVEAG